MGGGSSPDGSLGESGRQLCFRKGWVGKKMTKGDRSQRGSSDGGQGVKSVPGRVWEKAGEVRGQVRVSSSGLILRTGTLGRDVCFAGHTLLG